MYIKTNRVKRKTDNTFKGNAAFIAVILIGVMIFGSLGRVGYIMIKNGDEYREKAASNQLYDVTIEGVRGTIYDSKMMPLATSTEAWILIVNPYEFHRQFSRKNSVWNEEDYKKFTEQISKDIAKILGITKKEVKEKILMTDLTYKRIKQEVTPSQKNQLDDLFEKGYTKMRTKVVKRFLRPDEEKEEPVTIKATSFFYYESDTVREYAQGNFASTVIGVINADNNGETGIEKYYNDTLKGTAGRMVTAKDSRGRVLESSYETVFDPKEGNGIVLTIDSNIQGYLENALNRAQQSIKGDGVYGIVMDVDTGAILAVSDKPDFDLNDPRKLEDGVDKTTLDTLEKGSYEYNEKFSSLLYEQWSSFCLTETYEPGSTFKIFTAAAAIEEGVVNLNTTHTCVGSYKVADITYHCANNKSHGTQDLTHGLMNSCNTFFINVGQKLGVEAYSKYYEAFGFTEKTGVDINNEATPIYHDPETMTKVDLASTSFGQTIRISPLQLITAASAIANGGKLMQPYLVEKVVDSDGNVISETEPVVKRRVISESTSKAVISMMESVVGEDTGTGKNAYIEGYRVCGKTATAEKLDDNSDEDIYIASFLCFAPADDPEVAILVGVDNAPGPYRGGGVLAAPIAKEVLIPTLKYLGVEPHYTSDELRDISRSSPELTGKSLSEARNIAANEGLSVRVVGEGSTVISQVPKAGETVPKGGVVVVYTDKETKTEVVKVPDFRGLSASEVNRLGVSSGINVVFSGPTSSSGVRSYGQDIPADTTLEAGSKVTVYFSSDNIAVD